MKISKLNGAKYKLQIKEKKKTAKNYFNQSIGSDHIHQ